MIAIECKTEKGRKLRKITLAPLNGSNLPQCQRALAESVNASRYFVTADLHALPEYITETLRKAGYGSVKIGTVKSESATWGAYKLGL